MQENYKHYNSLLGFWELWCDTDQWLDNSRTVINSVCMPSDVTNRLLNVINIKGTYFHHLT